MLRRPLCLQLVPDCNAYRTFAKTRYGVRVRPSAPLSQALCLSSVLVELSASPLDRNDELDVKSWHGVFHPVHYAYLVKELAVLGRTLFHIAWPFRILVLSLMRWWSLVFRGIVLLLAVNPLNSSCSFVPYPFPAWGRLSLLALHVHHSTPQFCETHR